MGGSVPDAHFNASSVLVITVTLACEVPVAEDAAKLSGRIPRPPPTASQLVVYAAYGRHDPRQVWAVDGGRCIPGRPAAGFHGVRRLGFMHAAMPYLCSVLFSLYILELLMSRSFSTARVILRQRMRGT